MDFESVRNLVGDDRIGMDAFFDSPKEVRKISSLSDLVDFIRLGKNMLVHKSQKDLWRIVKDPNTNEVVIERLFDSNGEPLKV